MASHSRSKPYMLYLRKKYTITEGIHTARTVFVFVQSPTDATAYVQNWIYGGIRHGHWHDNWHNPLLNKGDRTDEGHYGYVDAAQVETPKSELRKIVAFLQADSDKFGEAWDKWYKKVKEEKLKKSDDLCDLDVERDIEENEGRKWTEAYFEALAEDRIRELVRKKLLKRSA